MKALTPAPAYPVWGSLLIMPEDDVDPRTAASTEPLFQNLINQAENLKSLKFDASSFSTSFTSALNAVITTGEQAALTGTSGTPGSGNRYVTDADPRLVNVAAWSSFRAYGASSSDPIVFPTVEYDVASEYNAANGHWVVAVTGTYLVDVGVMLSGTEDTNTIEVVVKRNGAQLRILDEQYIASAITPALGRPFLAELTATDVITVHVTGSGSGPANNSQSTWFAAIRVR